MATTGYSGRQIFLHWITAIIIAIQFAYHDGMQLSWRLIREGGEVPFSVPTAIHVALGIFILLLSLPRLGLRLSRGAALPPENESPGMARLAAITHAALYSLILLLPVSGLLAWFGKLGAAAVAHSILGKLLLLVVALHVLGALYQLIVLRSNVLWRMLRPRN